MRLYALIEITVLSVLSYVHVRTAESHNDTEGQASHSDTNDVDFFWTYLKEMSADGFTPRIIERTIDERWSNTLYFYSVGFTFDRNVQRLKSSDPDVIEEYARFISGPEVDQEKCSRHLRQMVDLLNELEDNNERMRINASSKDEPANKRAIDARHIRLAKVLDSYGHYPGGALESNEYIYGVQLECLETKLQFDVDRTDDLVGTRSCLATLDMHQHKDPKFRAHDKDGIHTAIHVGICVPNTCHSNSLDGNEHLLQRLIDSQFVLPKSLYVHQSRQLVGLFCVNDNNESIGYPTSGKVLLAFLSCWLLVVAFTTLRNDKSSSFDRYFNIKQSFDDFIGANDVARKSAVDYDALNGLKVICTFGIVLGHTMMIHFTISQDVARTTYLIESDRTISVSMQINMLVNTFFIMSGMITAHLTLREMRKFKGSLSLAKQIFICLRLIVARYFRIVPTYFLVFWFKKSVYLYSLWGLNMDRGYNKDSLYGACRSDSLLTPLLGWSAYKPLTQQCLSQAWSLACELFFIAVGGPIIVILSKRPKVGLTLALVLTVVSVWSQFSDLLAIDVNMLKHLDSHLMYNMLYVATVNSTVHSKSHNRLSTYLVAIAFGYLLHRFDWDESKRWPRWFSKHVTSFAATVLVSTILTGLFQQELLPYLSFNVRSVLNAVIFVQLVWPACNAVLLIRMMTDWKSSYIMRLFLGNFWRTMSKLGLGVLLVHGEMIYRSVAAAPSFPNTNTSIDLGSIYMNSLLMSFIIYLLFERPIEKMAKDLLSKTDRLLGRPSQSVDAELEMKSNKVD